MQEKIKLKVIMEKFRKRSRQAALLVSDTKQNISNTSETIKNVTDDPHTSSSEYATDKLERGTETVTREAGHLVVDTTKYAFQTALKTIIQIYFYHMCLKAVYMEQLKTKLQ